MPAQAMDWVERHGLTPSEYQSTFTDLAGKGYRPKVVSGYTSGGQERYAVLWVKTSGPDWAARQGLSSADYQTASDDFRKQGFRLVYVSGHAIDNQPRYAAIWEKTSSPEWEARHGLTAAQYQKAFDDLGKAGYRLRHINGYSVNGQDFYAAIWDKSPGPAWEARYGLSAADYQKVSNDLAGKGYRLKVISGYQAGAQDRYAALWEKTGTPLPAARHGIPGNFYQGVADNFYYQGYHPAYINVFASGNAERFNGIWENTNWKSSDLNLIRARAEAYRSKLRIPGLSIALTKDGRLVYAAGFGQADKSNGEEVSPVHLFRIASVSKPITSVTIMKLAEQGKLSLDQKVFGPDSLLGAKYATPANNRKIESITVRQLLEHTSGFTNAFGDPMLKQLGFTHDQLINWALAKKVPQNNAGSVYEYSNFGYCVLGRIVEKVTGQPYETYVRNEVLSQAGITRMQIGGNSLAEHKPGEVVYYPAKAYNLNVRRFDSNGGWIASPIDLMRFMVRADGLPTEPDIISADSYTTMTTKPGISDKNGNEINYASGWVISSRGVQWHNGSMRGTVALMARTPEGYGYAALANAHPGDDDPVGLELRQTLEQIIADISAWPAHDLF
ncbi:MAG TPA: serine hydrolase [Thermoanaerobaculia bacterium]|nr:serine hydrolase [Thermoanaerobaculia bacterium]